MIITRSWLNEFVDLSGISTAEICSKLNSIGLEVDSVREMRVPKRVIVAKVISCFPHENSDHLHVCDVDTGSEVLQIVCGAPNVAADQIVACAKIGAVMPNGMEIKRAKLRGVESSGMLCSAFELGLPKLNDGIMVFDQSLGELNLGTELAEFSLFNDDIIEIELTPNRGDCLSINGVARDLAAAFDLPMKNLRYEEDDEKLLGIGRILSLRGNTQASFSYRALELKGELEIPLKMRLRLALIDCAQKHPLLRILDYATYASGVILRAYDYDKIASAGEKLIFDLKTLENGTCAVFSGEKCLSVCGIYQDDSSKIDEKSRLIIIEASYCAPDIVANAIGTDKTLKKDELSYRSTRGSEPIFDLGLNLAFELFFKNDAVSPYTGAQNSMLESKMPTINFAMSELYAMSGAQIQRNDAVKILKKLGFEVNFNVEQDQIYVKAPIYRHDISNFQDVCEEIIRILSIDKIPSTPLEFSENNRFNKTYEKYKNASNLRAKAACAGFFECVHYVFDDADELKNLGFAPCKTQILNPISSDLSALRPTLLNHLIKSCERNVKNAKKSVKLFEFGEVFGQKGDQSSKFSFICSGFEREPSLKNGAKPAEIDFFGFVNLIQNVIGKIELKSGKNVKFLSEFEQAAVYQNDVKIGFLGRLDLQIEMERDLRATYLFELDFDALNFAPKIAHEYSKLPSVTRDLSLLMPLNLDYEQVKKCIKGLNLADLSEFLPVDLYKDESLKDKQSLTIKLSFQSKDRTLLDGEIEDYVAQILSALKRDLNIGLR